MKISASTLGFAGAATVAVTSTVLLNHHLGQNVDGNDKTNPNNLLFVADKVENMEEIEDDGASGTGQGGVALSSLFDVQKINRNSTVRPLLNFDKGSCFDSFFPEAALSAPTQTTTLSTNVGSDEVIPAGFSFAGSTQPTGCKMIKFAGAKDDAAFSYMTETTVRNDKYGLAMYAVATNTKQRTMTSFEYWLLFLQKDSNTWTTTKSYYLSLGLGTTVTTSDNKSTQKQNDFYAKTPNNVDMRWSSPATPSVTFGKFFETSTDTSSLWDATKDKYYVGLWTGGNDGRNEDLFYDGSNEKWALKEWFSTNDADKKQEPNRFLNQIKLTQKGKWQSIGEACSNLKNKAESSMTTGAISQCIQSKALASAVAS